MKRTPHWLSGAAGVLAPALLALCASRGSAQEAQREIRFDIGAVDRAADPCVDFYQFACGGWLVANPIPPDQSSWAAYQQMRVLNRERVQGILEQAAVQRAGRALLARQIGDYYAACRGEQAIEAAGLRPLREELERVRGVRSGRDLAEEVARLHGLGSDALFAIYPDQRLEDATQVIAYLDQSGLSLPEPGDYSSESAEAAATRSRFRSHLAAVFGLLGESAPQAAASADAVLGLETALARASLTPRERRDRSAWYHPMSVAELRRQAPRFAWERYFARLGITLEGELNVAVPAYVRAVDALAGDAPLEAWRSYLRWQLVRLATPSLPSRFRQLDFEFFERSLNGVERPPSREDQCAELANRDLGPEIGRIFVQRYFPPSTRERALDLVERLRRAMRQDFEEISWWGPATRQQALLKLEQLRVMIGAPDQWRDTASLRIARGDALGNALRARRFELERQLRKIGRPVARGELYELPQAVAGYHDNPLNVVVFTAGILQPPFFDPRLDDAVALGLAGGVIGHELTHAFDDKGHAFDGAGNLRDWWAPEDARSYDERAHCFVRQYSGYTAVGDVKVDGALTLGENIADNGGLQLAYRAFRELTRESPTALDGFTPAQRFFLGWARWRCANVTSEAAAVRARTDNHSPGRWRVNGVVSNMPAFEEAYSCRAGDPMVNSPSCRIW